MGRLAPQLSLVLTGDETAPLDLAFATLDDFHPDALFRRLPLFGELRALRMRLLDPSTFADAAAELKRSVGGAVAPLSAAGVQAEAAPPPAAEDDASLLGRLLGAVPGRAAGTPRRDDAASLAVGRLLQETVAPHVIAAIEPEQRLYVAAIDDSIARLMRAVLHHTHFQRLEAAWRELSWLVSSVETGEDLRISILDAGRTAIVADVRVAANDIGDVPADVEIGGQALLTLSQ